MRRLGIMLAIALAALVCGYALVAFNPALVIAGLVAVALVIVLARGGVRGFLWLSAAVKPVIDMFYNRGVAELTIQRVLGIAAPVLGIAMLIVSRVDVLVFPMVAPLLSFVLVNVLGLVFSLEFGLGLQLFFRVVGAFVFYFAASLILPNEVSIRRFIKVFLVTLIVPYSIALLQLVGVLPTPTAVLTGTLEGVRLIGPYADAWSLAVFLVISVPLTLMQISEADRVGRALWWTYLAASIVIVVFTNLKYAQIIVFLELVAWFVLTRQHTKVALVIASAAALVTANLSFLSGLYADVVVLFVAKDMESATAGLSGRVGVWELYLRSYREMPLLYRLFGTGLDYKRIAGTGTGIHADPHNDLLRVLVSNGWVGMVVYAWLLIAMGVFLVRSVRSLRAGNDPYRLRVAYVTVCVYIAYVGGSITARPSQYVSLTWYMWLFFGLQATWLMAQRGVEGDG